MTSPSDSTNSNNGQQEAEEDPPQATPSLSRRFTLAVQSDDEAEKLQRQITQSSHGMAVAGEHVMELEFEEWDGSTPFYQHCLAGSLAGVAEHLIMYPFDTLKTQIQSYCADCPAAVTATATSTEAAAAKQAMIRGVAMTESAAAAPAPGSMMGALQHHFDATTSNTAAFGRLWRGAQAMAVGCIPAHALYFSSYEVIKAFFLQRQADDASSSKNLGALGSTVAGSTAALCHDAVMVPADTIKQRLQLGYYEGMADAFRTMVRQEGAAGLYRALPVTLATNLPYGAVMVTTNEYLRELLMKQTNATTLDVKTTLLSGCGAGLVAAAVTTPLDRLKTRLQTQGLGMVVACDVAVACPKMEAPKYHGLGDAFRSIVQQEGYAGFLRGLGPRVLTHTPSVAISWTVYEAMKLWLASPSQE